MGKGNKANGINNMEIDLFLVYLLLKIDHK